MKAIVFEKCGVGEVREVPEPTLPDDGVRVRVRAAALNAMDYYFSSGTILLGRPMAGWFKPKVKVPGLDFAGTVEAVGGAAKDVRPGDEVFGAARGALAEYVCVAADRIAPKPAGSSFEEAAAIPVAGLTALQALRDHGHVQPGQQVLVNGASGGVGTFAVQLARAFGASVTAVCGTRHADLVRSLGAHRVIDYTREDFTRGEPRYDLMLDIAGSRPWRECRRVLKRDATVVVIGGPRTNRWVGPAGHILGMWLGSRGASQKVVMFIAKINRRDLVELKELVEAGKLKPVIDRRFEFAEASEALRYLGEGHVGGKVVVSV